MLVLSRKADEAIVLATPTGVIRVIVADIGDDRVRLAIDAPPNVGIVREELLPDSHQPTSGDWE